jgi:ATP-dependent helicase HrpA
MHLLKCLNYFHLRKNLTIDRWQRRKDGLPKITYPDMLPITAKKDRIIRAVRTHPVVIVTGETGSGKTTQIPKMCLAAERGIRGIIAHTQPRRIAAVAAAQRIADELGEPLGRSVGYKIRFDERTGPNPYIQVMTDGILLAEAQTDPYLRRYDTIRLSWTRPMSAASTSILS